MKEKQTNEEPVQIMVSILRVKKKTASTRIKQQYILTYLKKLNWTLRRNYKVKTTYMK